ncbi:hypothetical protein FGG08_002517 [Glutinoglossum americanum]|uniref:T6SS Phospholipase effector Tle1-like catalytic domain-containing protein n=1 Tax=Glutinoglossum americanum TaxID=1670608 RepID=A0A9P8I9J4_9PEZI|nr:hypothetical protein FGG08_002517 [Glutinoglossum americanum]
MAGPGDVHTLTRPGVQVRYADGVGLGSTFLNYLFNGATGHSIAEECTNAYRYIVENYMPGYEIWMFGLSRGAFTVRCVAGMINNCGIVMPIRNNAGAIDRDRTGELCEEVYKLYRSPYEINHPKSQQMQTFRANRSHSTPTPIKFMGLFDTVGSLGIPRFTGGVGFEWPEFYDQVVSSVVEHVYHAVSLHDRLWLFQPCLAFSGPGPNPNPTIHEMWFPGAHYDLGRQRFRFFRAGTNWFEGKLFGLLNLLANTIEPNHVLSDLVLRWMLESIAQHDPAGAVIQNIPLQLSTITDSIWRAQNTGDGDVYNNALDYIPFGNLVRSISSIGGLFGNTVESILSVKSILQILLAVRDRAIPDSTAQVYPYQTPDAALGQNTIEQLADMDARRYPSRTYQYFRQYR